MISKEISMLIIDDDIIILDLLHSIFEDDRSIKLHTCSDSKKALNLIQNYPYDIILSDLMMPDISGLELLKSAKKIHPDVMVVVITAYSSLVVTLEVIKAGAYDYITKPFQVDEILLVVNNAKEKIYLKRENERLTSQILLYQEEVSLLNQKCIVLEEKLLKMTSEQIVAGSPKVFENELVTTLNEGVNPQKFLYQNPYHKKTKTVEDKYKQEIERLRQLHKEGILTEEDYTRLSERLQNLLLKLKQ